MNQQMLFIIYLADINFDSIVDIFDLMLISNIILDY